MLIGILVYLFIIYALLFLQGLFTYTEIDTGTNPDTGTVLTLHCVMSQYSHCTQMGTDPQPQMASVAIFETIPGSGSVPFSLYVNQPLESIQKVNSIEM